MQFQGHDHGDVPAVSTCRVVECVALKSAGVYLAKALLEADFRVRQVRGEDSRTRLYFSR